jgi:hypothetical protein
MIKTTELRIGNTIEADQLGGGWATVTGLSRTGIEVKDFETWILPEKNSGIPLTPQILQEMGFEEWKMDMRVNRAKEIYLMIDVVDGKNAYKLNGHPKSSPIIYLHQLQNLYFTLTREELEIML